MIIKESFFLTASNADIFAGNTSAGVASRLNSIPVDGTLTVEVSANACDATNFGELTLNPPEGSAPFTELLIPYNGYNTSNALMHDDTSLVFELDVEGGGHVGLAYTENGTVVTLLYATFTF